MTLNPYPEYKDSGVAWLGSIPAHWNVLLNQRIFKENIRPYKGTKETQLALSQRDGLIPKSELRENSLQTSTFDNWKITIPGDLVLNRFKAHLGVFFETTMRGIVTFHYGVFEPRTELLTKYYELLYHTPTYRGVYAWSSNGMTVGLQNLSNQNFYNVRSLFPPLDEQQAIVRFLDAAETRIRRYIRAKQKLIKLLNEQKQAIIQQAVTRGLNPDVPMKDSGVEWLGEIPAHWEVLRGKFLFREINNRSVTGQETQLSMSQKYGLVPSDTLSEWRLRSESYVGAKICEPNDLILNRLKAHLGVFALASQQGLVSPDYTVLRAVRPMTERYFELTLRTPACRLELKQRAKGIVEGFWRLYTDDFYEIPLPSPSIEEQEMIVTTIDQQLENLEYAIGQIVDEIELIQEYRTRLISDVVTGKVDVRGLAFEMPEDFAEDDMLDVGEDELLDEDDMITEEDV